MVIQASWNCLPSRTGALADLEARRQTAIRSAENIRQAKRSSYLSRRA
jgi:hypothetical protein